MLRAKSGVPGGVERIGDLLYLGGADPIAAELPAGFGDTVIEQQALAAGLGGRFVLLLTVVAWGTDVHAGGQGDRGLQRQQENREPHSLRAVFPVKSIITTLGGVMSG